MAVLPTPPPHLFSAQQQPQSKKQMPAPSNATVAAIAAGRHPSPPAAGRHPSSPAAGRPKQPLRRMSSTTANELQRKSNPEKRANHNAIERARRESLNQRFLVLASKIPSISEVRRPSKSLIVNRSLQFVADSLAREEMYRKMIIELHDRTRVLTEQLNEYRLANGLQNYIETVPDLVLPVALADVPKDKPTARIVVRKNSNMSGLDGFDAAMEEFGMDEFDDGSFPVDDFSPTAEEPMAFFSQPSVASKEPTVPAPVPGQYAAMPTNAYGAPTAAPMDVNGTMFFHHQPISASPVVSSPVSQPDLSTGSPSTASPMTNTSFSPASVAQNHMDPMANFKMFPGFNLPEVGQHYGAPADLIDFASFLGQPAYPSA